VDSTLAGREPAVAARRPPTIYDVARLAGVSHQTVSRYLKGADRMGPDMRDRVRRALKMLDYKPNSAARALATNRSHRIGVLTHDVHQVGPSKVLQAAIAAARSAGYLLDVVDLDPNDGTAIRDALALLTAQDCAGILALAATDEMATAFVHIDLGLPVFIAAEPDDAVTSGTHPHAQGLSALVAHLAELGHTHFMHVSGPATYSSARNRGLAYDAAVSRLGLRSFGSVDGDWTAASGYSVGQHIPVEAGVTAVIAANDQMAGARRGERHRDGRHRGVGVFPAAADDAATGFRQRGRGRVPADVDVHRRCGAGAGSPPAGGDGRACLDRPGAGYDRTGALSLDRVARPGGPVSRARWNSG